MKKNILITGASGFIGSFLVEEALKRNYETFAGIRSTSSKKYLADKRIHFLELDFNDENSLRASLKKFASENGRFDLIIHSAGLTKALRKADYSKVNYENTKRFVHALVEADMVPDKFVYISSLSSFGPGFNNNRIHSGQVQQPLTEYGKSKLKTEKFLDSVPGFPYLVINPTAVYGPRDKDFIHLLKTIQKHLEVYIGGNDQLLTFIHVNDLVKAIFLSIESPTVNQNLLVSDLNVYTAKTFNSIVKKTLNKKTFQFVVPVSAAGLFAWVSELSGKIRGKASVLTRERLKDLGAKNWSVDCEEIIQLGYMPQFSLEEGLKHTIAWYLEEGWIKNNSSNTQRQKAVNRNLY